MNAHDKPPPELADKQESLAPSGSPHSNTPALHHSTTPSPPDWPLLLQQTEYFAAAEIDGYCWREVNEGVLPSGYDASSVAAEAVAELFREAEASLLALSPRELKRELRRRARKIVNRLHHRMENQVMVIPLHGNH